MEPIQTTNQRRLSKLLGQLVNNSVSARKKAIPPPTIVYSKHPSTFPKPTRNYWGKNADQKHDENIYPINPLNIFTPENQELVNKYIDLWLLSNKNNKFHHSIKYDSPNWETLSKMKGIGYGINFNDFSKLIQFWKHKFNLNQQINKLNSFNHFKTNIQGLNIHFIRESTSTSSSNTNTNECKCDAILLLHGWPGSFWEFHKIIDILKSKLNNIDIIIASLPGFGYSEYPMHYTNFNVIAVGSIIKELMEKRLKYNNYIISAGDWGAHIARCIGFQSSLEPDSDRKLLGILLNDTFTSGKDLNINSNVNLKNISKSLDRLLDFSGYQHIQCTRPNTIGIALESSPIAILAWIYEMYLAATDGPVNLKRIKYDMDDCRIIGGELNWNDIIMTAYFYWLNGRITTSSCYYAENIRLSYTTLRYYYMPQNINIGIVNWKYSMGFEPWNKYHFRNIVYQNKMKLGGHFTALERPIEYVENIVNFVNVFK